MGRKLQQYLLMIQGQDEEGLINKITGCLYFQGLNIISNHEFVDTDTNRFFMRSEFTGNMNEETLMTALHKQLPDNFEIEIRPQRKKQIIVFATKEHHCLADLLIREAYGNLNAEILAISLKNPFIMFLIKIWIAAHMKTKFIKFSENFPLIT